MWILSRSQNLCPQLFFVAQMSYWEGIELWPPGNGTRNLGVLGQRSNQLSYPVRAWPNLFLLLTVKCKDRDKSKELLSPQKKQNLKIAKKMMKVCVLERTPRIWLDNCLLHRSGLDPITHLSGSATNLDWKGQRQGKNEERLSDL